MNNIDKELTAMKRIANALQSLDVPARLRVMTWMISAHEHEQKDAFESEDVSQDAESSDLGEDLTLKDKSPKSKVSR